MDDKITLGDLAASLGVTVDELATAVTITADTASPDTTELSPAAAEEIRQAWEGRHGVTVGDLARQLGAEPHEILAFAGITKPMHDDDALSADTVAVIRENWSLPDDEQDVAATWRTVTAELSALRQEYADFRARVVRVGTAQAIRRGWCDEWKEIAIDEIGLRHDEFPPTHADVKINLGGVEIPLTVALDRDGKVSQRVIVADLREALNYDDDLIRELRGSDEWFEVTRRPFHS